MQAVNASRMAVVAAVLMGVTSARAAEEAAVATEPVSEPVATAAASVDVTSAYIFRGATINDEVNVQPGLEGLFFGSLTLGTWGNGNTDTHNIDEIDYYGSYALPLGECPVGLSVGYTEYTYPTQISPADPVAGTEAAGLEADREINVAAALVLNPCDKSTWTTTLTGNIGVEGPFLDDGLNITADTVMAFDLNDNLGLNGGATAAMELGDNFADDGISYAQLNAGVTYAFLNAGVHYVIETDEDVLVVDEDFWGSVGIVLPL